MKLVFSVDSKIGGDRMEGSGQDGLQGCGQGKGKSIFNIFSV